MKTSKLIKEIIGESIKPNGFELKAHDRESWVYTKQAGEFTQRITIRVVSRDFTRLNFSTNAFGQKQVDGASLVKEGENKGDEIGDYIFKTEQEFTEVLEYFKKIIFDYGFEALERMSAHTTEVRPTKETNLYLYENHEELNKLYREKLNIDDSTAHEDIFQIIQDYLVKTQGSKFEDIKQDLIGIAAVYGTVYAGACNGGWEWDSESNICWVTDLEKYPIKEYPLSKILHCWRKGTEYTAVRLNNSYKYVQK